MSGTASSTICFHPSRGLCSLSSKVFRFIHHLGNSVKFDNQDIAVILVRLH